MEEQKSHKSPFRPLGRKLKALRDKAKESLAETSGAVEIDVRELAGYELGQAKPSEEVLLLLISHFGVQDQDAVGLWELAGYGTTKASSIQMTNDDVQTIVKQAVDNKILFTDIVDISVNNYGVVMNFLQGSGVVSQPTSVARVGMSREHAKSVLQILQVTLNQTEQIIPKIPRKISAPDNKSPDENSKT